MFRMDVVHESVSRAHDAANTVEERWIYIGIYNDCKVYPDQQETQIGHVQRLRLSRRAGNG